jgi:hypothetical protein
MKLFRGTTSMRLLRDNSLQKITCGVCRAKPGLTAVNGVSLAVSCQNMLNYEGQTPERSGNALKFDPHPESGVWKPFQ